MAGSVYLKGEHPALITAFKNRISNRVKQSANFILLQVPPVAGAVVWAAEELVKEIPLALRKSIIQSLMQI